MTLKKYRFCRLAIVVMLSMSISVAISLENYYLSLVFLLSATAGLYYCRQQLKTAAVLADERDYEVAGRAARYTILVYGWLGAVGTFVLMALSNKEGQLHGISQYLAFSVCFVMLLNACLFRYLSKRS